MKANLDKCHLLLSITEAFNFQISETVIHNSHSRKMLGVTFDNKLKFEKHLTTLCQKANKKLNALARVISYMDLPGVQLQIMDWGSGPGSNWNLFCTLTIQGKTRALRNSVQIFIEIQGWLLLTLFIYLHNQLSSFNSSIVRMSEKRDSSDRQ